VDDEFLSRMRAEEAELTRKLTAVRHVIAAYSGSSPQSSASETKPRDSQRRPRTSLDGFGTYGRLVVTEAMKALLPAREPVITRKLVEELQAKGIEIRGNDPVNALSALLARSADVTSHGRKGWTITDREKFKQMLGEQAHKQTEAPNGKTEGASAVADTGAPTPGSAAWVNPQSRWTS
jgi:hypothetical protein